MVFQTSYPHITFRLFHLSPAASELLCLVRNNPVMFWGKWSVVLFHWDSQLPSVHLLGPWLTDWLMDSGCSGLWWLSVLADCLNCCLYLRCMFESFSLFDHYKIAPKKMDYFTIESSANYSKLYLLCNLGSFFLNLNTTDLIVQCMYSVTEHTIG